jgi:hypothetical protein
LRESSSDTFIWSSDDPAIIDQHGNSWTLSPQGQVVIDGITDTSTRGVVVMAYLNRRVWQWNDQRLWWSKTSPLAPWLPPEGQPDAPFGPVSDPRIDTVLSRLGQIASEQARLGGNVAAGLEAIKDAVYQVPQNISPDPRIDTLLSGQIANASSAAAEIAALSLKVDVLTGMIQAWQQDVLTRLDLIETQVSDQTKLDAVGAQLARVIQMLLDLFPAKPPTVRLGADLTKATHPRSQAAPDASGP